MKKNIAILASGTGSNAEIIIDHFKHHEKIAVSLVVSNKASAPVLDIAKKNGIATLVVNRQLLYETEDILKIFNRYSIDFVVLAGFLWLVPGNLVRAYRGRMVNIHPALLPKYGGKGMYGMNVHRAVYEAGERETGMTIHFVNEQYDDGAIVFQASCPITPEDTPETIAKKVLKLEHEHYPRIIEKLVATS